MRCQCTSKRHVKELGNVTSNKRERERERDELRDAVPGFLPAIRNARRTREFIPSAITPRFWPGNYRRENARMESTWPEAHRRDGDPQPSQFRAFALPRDFYCNSPRRGWKETRGAERVQTVPRQHSRVWTHIHTGHTYTHTYTYEYTRMHVTAFTLNPICLG